MQRVLHIDVQGTEGYLHQVSLFARHFDRSPVQLRAEEIRKYEFTWPWNGRLLSEPHAGGQRPGWRAEKPPG